MGLPAPLPHAWHEPQGAQPLFPVLPQRASLSLRRSTADRRRDRYVLQARSSEEDLWVCLDIPTVNGDPAPLLPDGRNLAYLVADGDTGDLPGPPVFRTGNHGHTGDMLWTTGLAKIVSTRFLDVLQDIRATGYRTFPIDVRDHRNRPITGSYHGFTTPGGEHDDLADYAGVSTELCVASARVVQALTRHGVTELDIQPANQDGGELAPPP